MEKIDLAIIGSGPAGCSACIYVARTGLSYKVFTGAVPGGQLINTPDIENFIGTGKPVSGFELIDGMHKQCKSLGADFINRDIKNIETKESPFILEDTAGDKYEVKSIIIATGAKARWLNIPSEEKYKGKGVSACATCDGFFFKDKPVVVVGGGNTAFEDALFLSSISPKVTLIHRREGFRATPFIVEKIKTVPNIDLELCSVVEEIYGDDHSIDYIEVKNVVDETIKKIECRGIFVAIGSIPQTDFLENTGIKIKESGHIEADERTHTAIRGIFACGDCADSVYRQAITSAGTGAKAAIEAQHYINFGSL